MVGNVNLMYFAAAVCQNDSDGKAHLKGTVTSLSPLAYFCQKLSVMILQCIFNSI